MKSVLICPDSRIGVAALAEAAPLAAIPILGKPVVEYWMEHVASLGAKEVLIVAGDRPEVVRSVVGDGARWGLHAKIMAEDREPTLREAYTKYRANPAGTDREGSQDQWLSAPNDIVVIDHLPGSRSPLITSYSDWFETARTLMPQALTPDRIGVHELKPGVWIGMHSRIAPDAKLIAPCWIGEHVWIEGGAVVGPNAILEREVFVARGAEVSQSIICPDTFVGRFTEVHNSIAWGNALINWERDSCLKVPDEFLLCSLEPQRTRQVLAKTSVPRALPASPALRLREYVSQWLAALSGKISPPC